MPHDMHVADAAIVDAPFLQLNVRLADGAHFKPDAAAGFRVMDLIRAYGLPIKAECGGAGVCATCHVRVPAAWSHLLVAAVRSRRATFSSIATARTASG